MRTTCFQVDLSSSIDDLTNAREKFGRAVNLLGAPATPPDYKPPTSLDDPPALPLWRTRLRWYIAGAPVGHVCAKHVKAGVKARRECPDCHDVVRDAALRAAKQIGGGFVAPEVVGDAIPQLDWPTAALSVELGRFTRPRRPVADFAADAERARAVLSASRDVVTAASRGYDDALRALADVEARRATESAIGYADGGPDYAVLHALAEEEAEIYSDLASCREVLDAVDPTSTDLEIAPHVSDVRPLYSQYVSALPMPAERATWFVRAPLGAGKTESVRGLVEASKSLLYLTPRRVLSRDAAERLRIQNYEDTKSTLPQKCVVTMPSVLRYPLWCDSAHFMMALGVTQSQPGLVMLLDEVSQLREMWHASLMKKKLRAGYQHFATLVSSAHLVVALDAHLGVADVEWLKSLRDAPTTYATMPVPRGDRAYLRYESVHELRLDLVDWLAEETHTAWVSTTSRRESLILEELLLEHGVESLRLDKDTYPAWADEDKRTPISSRLNAHRVVIATPVITSGVSITGEHFDRVYAFAPARGAEAVDPDEVRQMTARVRTPKDRVVRVWVDAQTERLPADQASVGAELLARTGRRATLNALDEHLLTLKRDGVSSQRLRADFGDAFALRCADSKDVCVRLPAPNDETLKQRAAELKQQRTLCRKRVVADHVAAVMGAGDVTREELTVRRRRGESLYYEGERLRIRETYGDVLEDHVEFDAMGTRQHLVKRYAAAACVLRADSANLHAWWSSGVASDKLTTLLRGDYVEGHLTALAVHGFGLTDVVLRRVEHLAMVCTPDSVVIGGVDGGVDVTKRIKAFDDPIAWAVLGLRRRRSPYFMLRALAARLGFRLPTLKTPRPKAVRLVEAEVDNEPLRVPKHAAHLMNLYSNSSRYSYTALYEYEAAEKARLEEKRRAKRKKPPQDRLGARESRAHG